MMLRDYRLRDYRLDEDERSIIFQALNAYQQYLMDIPEESDDGVDEQIAAVGDLIGDFSS